MKDLIFRSKAIQDTEEFAHLVASLIKKRDLILLKGELGSGKTTFARSIINSEYFANDINHVVPSPTFNLLQTYEFGDRTMGHADLCRIQNKEEITVLDLQKIVDEGSLIVEWPEIIDSLISANILRINFEIHNNSINLIVKDGGGWKDRIRSISFKS
jgi:ATPase, YjeE family